MREKRKARRWIRRDGSSENRSRRAYAAASREVGKIEKWREKLTPKKAMREVCAYFKGFRTALQWQGARDSSSVPYREHRFDIALEYLFRRGIAIEVTATFPKMSPAQRKQQVRELKREERFIHG